MKNSYYKVFALITSVISLGTVRPAHAGHWVLDHYKWSTNIHEESVLRSGSPTMGVPMQYVTAVGPDPTSPPNGAFGKDREQSGQIGPIRLFDTQTRVSWGTGAFNGTNPKRQGSGSPSGKASIKFSVNAVFRWVRTPPLPGGQPFDDLPPSQIFIKETSSVFASEQMWQNDGWPVLKYNLLNPYKGKHFQFKNIRNGFGNPLVFIDYGEDPYYQAASYLSIGSKLSVVNTNCGSNPNDCMVETPQRTLSGEVEQNSAWTDENFDTKGSGNISVGYTAETAPYDLNVTPAEALGVISPDPQNKHYQAYAFKGLTNSWIMDAPSRAFWEGPSGYSVSLSQDLSQWIGTPTYAWSSTPVVKIGQLKQNPSPQETEQSDITTNTQAKSLHHDLGATWDPKDMDKSWQSKVKVLFTGDKPGAPILKAEAKIDWFPKPITEYETKTEMVVYDAETGELFPFENAATEPDDGAPADLYQQMKDKYTTDGQVVTTGAGAVRIALEVYMMVGTWFVPDEFDVVTLGAGEVVKVVRTAKKLHKMMEVIHDVGAKGYQLLKLTDKWKDKPCALIMRTKTFRVTRGGHIPPGHKQTEEILGEVNHEINGDPTKAAIKKVAGVGCFIAGTPVLMADGTFRPIEQVVAGDKVLSRNESTGETRAKPVIQTFIHDVNATLALSFAGGERIVTTSEHPFYVEGRGFTPAGEVGIGTGIVTRAGPSLIVEKIEHLNSSKVYNFTVDDFHTYFVGSAALWVHNIDCGDLAPLAINRANEIQNLGLNKYERPTTAASMGVEGLPGLHSGVSMKNQGPHSNKPLHPNVQAAINQGGGTTGSFGQCAEMEAVSELLTANPGLVGSNFKVKAFAVEIRSPGNPIHGAPKAVCADCMLIIGRLGGEVIDLSKNAP